MRAGLADGAVLLDLPGEAAPEVHGAGARLVGLKPEHAGTGQLVVSRPTARLLLHLHHVDGIPAPFDFLRPTVASFFDQDDAFRLFC